MCHVTSIHNAEKDNTRSNEGSSFNTKQTVFTRKKEKRGNHDSSGTAVANKVCGDMDQILYQILDYCLAAGRLCMAFDANQTTGVGDRVYRNMRDTYVPSIKHQASLIAQVTAPVRPKSSMYRVQYDSFDDGGGDFLLA